MRNTIAFLAISLVATGTTWAQSAPGGPLSPSSGWAAQRAGVGPVGSQPAILGKREFFFSTLTNSAIGGKTETALRYGVTDKLSVGLTHLQRQGKLRPNVNYTLVTESVESPSINIGFYESSIGGQNSAYYATTGRTISDMGPVTFSGYVGVAKVTGERNPRFLAGASVPLLRNLVTASALWEGKKLSLGLVGSVGTLGGYPIRLGLVTVGDTVGSLVSSTWKQ